jgi:hypothetical protein
VSSIIGSHTFGYACVRCVWIGRGRVCDRIGGGALGGSGAVIDLGTDAWAAVRAMRLSNPLFA